VELAAAHGLDANASALVLERVYPTRWISPRLYRAGDEIDLALDGFETAVYELYPIEEAAGPLVAGVVFDVVSEKGRERTIRYHSASKDAVLLNPAAVRSVKHDGKTAAAGSLALAASETKPPAGAELDLAIMRLQENNLAPRVTCALSPSVTNAYLAVLLSPAAECTAKEKPVLSAELNGAPATANAEPQEGKSQWWTVPLPSGSSEAVLRVTPGAGDSAWAGTAQVCLVANKRHETHEIAFELAAPPRARALPPLAWPAGETRRNVLLGITKIATQ
jgi:hypothetical protein